VEIQINTNNVILLYLSSKCKCIITIFCFLALLHVSTFIFIHHHREFLIHAKITKSVKWTQLYTVTYTVHLLDKDSKIIQNEL
jgi:hypothetical protein